MAKKTLQREDWIKAAFKALTRQGPSGIRVESIARQLKVSKGSFYWHFTDLKALKTAMLNEWVELGTQQIIRDSDSQSNDPMARFEALGRRMTSERADEPYGGLLAESAIRDWSRYDKQVSKVVREVNAARLAYLEALLRDIGLPRAASKRNAATIYGALIGLEFLRHQELADLNAEMKHLMRTLVEPAIPRR